MADNPPGKQKGARANREGDPWKRPDGRWTVRVYPPEDSIDRKPRQVYGKTRREVIAKRDELAGKLARGLPKDPNQTVGDYFHRWLYTTLPQYVRAGELAESTMDSYRDNAEKHIIPDVPGVPTLWHIRLTALDAPLIREWQDRLSQKPAGRQRRKLRKGEAELPPPPALSPRTVAYCRAILHKALADAIRDETAGLDRNVADKVKPPRKRQQKARVIITPEQASALLAEMDKDRLWCYWLLAFALGFRRGEGLGMRWSDLNLEDLTWTPQLTVQRLRGEKDPDTGKRPRGRLVTKELKTGASAEKIAIGVTAAADLARWRRDQRKIQMAAPRWLDPDLVFTTGLGTALEPRNVNRAWVAICARAGVPGVRLHDLRHACASFLLAAGVDLKTVQATLRHANLSTTERYLHALREVPRGAADAMDELLTVLHRPGRKAGP
jgi:integrase